MMLAHCIALDPNNVQATHLARAAGTARFAYNWALAEWKRQYEAWKLDNTRPKPSQHSLRRQLNAIKREQFPWMLEVTKNAPQMAIIQLGQAFQNFFAKRTRYPQFRRKGVHDRFSLTNDQFAVDGKRIRIPNLGLRGKFCRRPSPELPMGGLSALLSNPRTIHICPKPKTKARWVWIWGWRRWQPYRRGKSSRVQNLIKHCLDERAACHAACQGSRKARVIVTKPRLNCPGTTRKFHVFAVMPCISSPRV